MRALKVMVAVMGVLIVVGTVTLVTLVVQRAGGGFAGSGRQDVMLGEPEGARIAGVAGAEGALAIWVQRPDGDRVVLVDPKRGRVTGELRLR